MLIKKSGFFYMQDLVDDLIKEMGKNGFDTKIHDKFNHWPAKPSIDGNYVYPKFAFATSSVNSSIHSDIGGWIFMPMVSFDENLHILVNSIEHMNFVISDSGDLTEFSYDGDQYLKPEDNGVQPGLIKYFFQRDHLVKKTLNKSRKEEGLPKEINESTTMFVYPMSYILSITNRGMFFCIFDQYHDEFAQNKKTIKSPRCSWILVQHLVDEKGKVFRYGQTPLHCLYSKLEPELPDSELSEDYTSKLVYNLYKGYSDKPDWRDIIFYKLNDLNITEPYFLSELVAPKRIYSPWYAEEYELKSEVKTLDEEKDQIHVRCVYERKTKTQKYPTKAVVKQFTVREADVHRASPMQPAEALFAKNPLINNANSVPYLLGGSGAITIPKGIVTSRYYYPYYIDMIAFTSADLVGAGARIKVNTKEDEIREYEAVESTGLMGTGTRILYLVDENEYETKDEIYLGNDLDQDVEEITTTQPPNCPKTIVASHNYPEAYFYDFNVNGKTVYTTKETQGFTTTIIKEDFIEFELKVVKEFEAVGPFNYWGNLHILDLGTGNGTQVNINTRIHNFGYSLGQTLIKGRVKNTCQTLAKKVKTGKFVLKFEFDVPPQHPLHVTYLNTESSVIQVENSVEHVISLQEGHLHIYVDTDFEENNFKGKISLFRRADLAEFFFYEFIVDEPPRVNTTGNPDAKRNLFSYYSVPIEVIEEVITTTPKPDTTCRTMIAVPSSSPDANFYNLQVGDVTLPLDNESLYVHYDTESSPISFSVEISKKGTLDSIRSLIFQDAGHHKLKTSTKADTFITPSENNEVGDLILEGYYEFQCGDYTATNSKEKFVFGLNNFGTENVTIEVLQNNSGKNKKYYLDDYTNEVEVDLEERLTDVYFIATSPIPNDFSGELYLRRTSDSRNFIYLKFDAIKPRNNNYTLFSVTGLPIYVKSYEDDIPNLDFEDDSKIEESIVDCDLYFMARVDSRSTDGCDLDLYINDTYVRTYDGSLVGNSPIIGPYNMQKSPVKIDVKTSTKSLSPTYVELNGISPNDPNLSFKAFIYVSPNTDVDTTVYSSLFAFDCNFTVEEPEYCSLNIKLLSRDTSVHEVEFNDIIRSDKFFISSDDPARVINVKEGYFPFEVKSLGEGTYGALTITKANSSGTLLFRSYVNNKAISQALKFNLPVLCEARAAATFWNGDFHLGTIENEYAEEITSVPGWIFYNEQVFLNGRSTIMGWPTPSDDDNPRNNKDGMNTAINTVAYFKSWLDSNEQSPNSTPDSRSAVMESVLHSERGFAIAHGPYLVSTAPVMLVAGKTVRFWWKAQGGSDAYDIFSYMLNVKNGNTIILANETGATTSYFNDWTLASHEVTPEEEGDYHFVFLSGTYDFTGGQALGARLYVTMAEVV